MPTTPNPIDGRIFEIDDGVRLEQQFHKPFKLWKDQPTPENADQMITAVQPVIDQAVRRFVGSNPSPTIRSRAKLMTLKALETYDPKRAQLNTHIISQLQGLHRAAAREERVLSVPEQVALDWKRLFDTENDFKLELGREPSDIELADKTNLSLKRIQYVRQMRPTVAEGMYLQPTLDDEIFSPAVEGRNEPRDRAWVEFVYQDLAPTDRLILEYSLGMHGKPRLGNQQIAGKLGISPAAISQRRVKIQALLDRQDELGVF